ncbi:MAG: thiamine-phosphate kinase [Halomonadaceae bacterium]|nr:MAG: thiamine-phosphate kinase [Halomonadaceae bacterium]
MFSSPPPPSPGQSWDERACIEHLWQPLGQAVQHPWVLQGIGDDGARLHLPADHELVLSVDTLVADCHFPAAIDPEDLGWRALAVNLSDLAAMGAQPVAYTLALTIPSLDAHWLTGLCRGLLALARLHGVQLVGGDMTRGPLSLTLQVQGAVPVGQALLRSGARCGDLVCVSGDLGAAAVALDWLDNDSNDAAITAVRQAYFRPTPRCELAYRLRGQASAALDISDGLALDLQRLLKASGVGARIHSEQIPVNPHARALQGQSRALQQALCGGDDYQLCFTWPGSEAALNACVGDQKQVTVIGRVTAEPGLVVLANGQPMTLAQPGYDHFRNP